MGQIGETATKDRSDAAGGGTVPQPQQELLAAGVPVSLYHRSEWIDSQPTLQHHTIIVRGSVGVPAGQIAIQLERSRSLPGHLFGRVHRFGEGLRGEALQAAARALAAYAKGNSRLLRLNVSVFALEGREAVGQALAAAGFRRSPSPLSYRHTLVMDLSPEEPELLARMDKNVRRDLRETDKANARVEVLIDERFAGRIDDLETAAMQRSGGSFRRQNWPAVLKLSQQHPELSRVAGMFLADTPTEPEHMVSFAWGCMHGNHAEYRSAGTTRIQGSRLSLSTPVIWNLVLWSRRQGALWFDMGGVSVEEGGALAGISEFKRRFSPDLREVGEDWYLEPSPLRSRAATLLGRGAKAISSALKRNKAHAS